MSLYYHLGYPDNAYLGGKTYLLAGGGSISPVPEPAGLLAAVLTVSLLTRRQRESEKNRRRV
jgi:hypothetical protein